MFNKLTASQGRRRSWSPLTFGTSAILHGTVLGGVVYASVIAPVIEEGDGVEEVTFVDFQEAPPPPPPPPPPPMEAVMPDVPPPPLGFQELVLPDIVPMELPEIDASLPPIRASDYSGLGVRGGVADGDSTVTEVRDLSEPVFTPMEVVPSVRNADEVVRALQRAYPPLLRSAGVGGTAIVWFFINENGVVERSRVSQSSGYAQLDEAALGVASLYRFSPAMNRDRPVPVWVQIPVVFQAQR